MNDIVIIPLVVALISFIAIGWRIVLALDKIVELMMARSARDEKSGGDLDQ